MNLRTILLSGDTQTVTQAVGEDLGVDEAVGELLPDQKASWLPQLRGKRHNMAMVGDGINDAPALVEANVVIAMGSGTDVVRESADVILIGSDLSKLVETLRVARRCRRHHHAELCGQRLSWIAWELEWRHSVFLIRSLQPLEPSDAQIRF